MGWLLALDGATEQLSLALVASDGRVRAHAESGGALASARLLPAVRALLAEAGCTGVELSALAFGRGPGAFTGLRAVCACVQGLAWGWNKPVLAIDSLLLPVEIDTRDTVGPVASVMDARMGEVYAARYRLEAGGWLCEVAPGLWKPETLRAAWEGTVAHWVGNGCALLGVPTPMAQPSLARAEALGRVALQAWRRGEWLDAAHAQPLYVRDKVAQTTAERTAERMSKVAA